MESPLLSLCIHMASGYKEGYSTSEEEEEGDFLERLGIPSLLSGESFTSVLTYGEDGEGTVSEERTTGSGTLPFVVGESWEDIPFSSASDPLGEDTTSKKSPPTGISLPEFEQLLPEGSPKPQRRSKSPKKTTKRSLPPSSTMGTHPVTKRRHILPKGPQEETHSQSSSGSISPSSLANILLELSEGGPSQSVSSPPLSVISEDTESDSSPVDPQPSTSGMQGERPSGIPLTFDSSSSTSSSQGSPTLAATTEEVVKVFVYGEDESVRQAAAASEQSQSVMPLIKEELRTKIQLKRLMSGEEEAEVEFKKPDFKMSLDEVKRRERKKEQNRQAALRSRQKQWKQDDEIIQKHKDKEKERKELMRERQRLQEEKRVFTERLSLHINTQCQLDRREEDAETLNQLQGGSK